MKKILSIYITALAALLAVSCTQEFQPDAQRATADGETSLVMRVRSTAPETRMVPSIAEEDLNEFVLEHYYYFIYKNNPAETAGEVPVFVGKWVAPEGTKVVGTGTEEKVPLDKLTALASADGNTYSGYVYVIANYKDATYAAALDAIVNAASPDYSTLTWAYLQNLPLPATFQSYNIVSGNEIMNEKQDQGHRFKPQDSFVMASEPADFSVEKGVEGSVDAELKRLAAKVSIEVDMAKWYVQYNNGTYKYTWYSDPSRIQVYMNYAADKGTMDGTPITYENAGDFFTYRRFSFVQDGVDEEGGYTPADGTYAEKEPLKWILKTDPAATQPESDGNYYTADEDVAGKIVEVGGQIQYLEYDRPAYKITGTPFYSYPYDFTNDSGHAPFFKIIVEWTGYNEASGRIATASEEGTKDVPQILAHEFYYKITIPEIKIFNANQWIRMRLHLSTLGSEADEAAIDVSSDTYFITNWSDPTNPDVPDINAGIYLNVAKDVFDMYENSLDIPVSASGPLVITAYGSATGNPSATYPLGTSDTTDPGSLTYSTTSSTGRNFMVTPAANHEHVQINHTVLPFSTSFSATNGNAKDIAIITYKFRIALKDHPNLYKDVTVYQYPSVYMKRQQSRGYAYVNGFRNTTAYNNNDTNLGGVQGANTGGSTGDYFTIVSVSTLSGVSATYPDWTIGDPRAKLGEIYEEFDNQWVRNDLGSSPEFFDNYLIGEMNTANVIAPMFMLATGYGYRNSGYQSGTSTWRSNAERCASYQEDGYPAGRWRLPTEAELIFCATLASHGLIENPFVNGVAYWGSSQRLLYYQNNATSFSFRTQGQTNIQSVRCVYDLWYWGDEPVEGVYQNYTVKLPED